MNKKTLIYFIFFSVIGFGYSQFLRPQIAFFEDGHDFGTIQENLPVDYVFTFINLGGDTLVINNVSTTCGCTAGLLSKNRILPGEKGTLKVSFDPKGKIGMQSKSVIVFSNDPDKPQKQLLIKANVVKELPKPDYSNSPKIQFTTRVHNFGKVAGGKVYETVFKFKNVGKQVLEIKEVKTSCGCTAAITSKSKIQPNENGEIKVEFDTAGRSGIMSRTISVFSNDPENPVTTLEVSADLITE